MSHHATLEHSWASAALNDVTMCHLEFVFQEQSYSSLHSGQSLAWDHVRDDPCGVIAISAELSPIPVALLQSLR